ncbi:polyketide cyclase [Arthrobacter sp. ERGS1:01]|uniref:polyketide cyclase n=1 Tax=Arthrobacter sp. ERGS1:01 TaxID=1704044 RepID=UPI0006B549F5|nr:polyketide cyclase [Arthrobacter sp. ERGS1:01]ALE06439.1 polyketide cyclase [Arthrobacter sp. ERGS1:01]
MWTTNYAAETTANPTAVWDALRDLHSGIALGPDSDKFELHGPFAVGTHLTVTPQGQEPMQSVIVELEPGVVYADQTTFGDLLLTFRHELVSTAAGGTAVTQTLEITGAGSDDVGPEIGPQISADFPSTMAELFASAESGLRG